MHVCACLRERERERYILCVNRTGVSFLSQNVTDGKSPPEWATDDVIHQLNNLSDFTMTLLFNSKGKSRITAGKHTHTHTCYSLHI